ncbi:MAG: flavodoxin family protein [Clostridia bacterium]|nr:flavodoxin family protein [Clostridia bacterium]MDD4571703.1 flavodoxin family protein [Clostridia bacterium]
MKVVLLSGSPKKEGNTMQALTACAKTLEKNGLEAEVLSLAGKTIAGCKACNACKKTGKCAIDDGLNEIMAKIKDAEGFIVGAPVYFGTARGEMMNAIQRISMVSYGTTRWLNGKVGGPVVVARRGGLTSTLQEMLMFYFINGMVVPGSTYWNILFGGAPGAVMKDEEGVNTITNFAEKVADTIKKLNV